MSGGSFNYLCYKDIGDLFNGYGADLQHMADVLAGEFPTSKAALVTTAFVMRLNEVRRELQTELDDLTDVWHAVEWWRSCDWSRKQVEQAIAAYEAKMTDGSDV